jgi:UDP-N-acetylglucosamine 2-epimerase (non-hydrolysing)
MNLTVVYGTRPEAIKLAPVVAELRRCGALPTIISTGQHTSLLRGTPAESTMAPHVSLGLPSDNDPLQYAQVCEGALRAKWARDTPDLVVVQGDTASAYAAAAGAWIMGIPTAHVEAGIRTGDVRDPWPEEQFRINIDSYPTVKAFCATQGNQDHIRREREARGACVCDMTDIAPITGNSGIDALYAHTKPTTEIEDRVLVTLHRRESFGEPLRHLVAGIVAGSWKHPFLEFVWPTHPNPKVQEAIPLGSQNLTFRAPVPAVEFAYQLSTCRAVITDSGGVQEEAAALGVPCIVAREKTDRPESVETGLAKVVGRTEQGILDGLGWALGFTQRPDPSTCFGDGHAAPRIVSHLLA